MKRFILLLLAFVLLVPTAACGASAAPQSTGDSFAPQAQTATAEAVASASPVTPALPDTLSDEEKEDLIAAYELGIAPESFLSTLEKPITQFDATMLIRNANDLYFGAKHSKYLKDVANHIAEKEQVASRYWIAQNIFYAHCEDVFDAPYTDAKTWAEYCDQQGEPPELFPDATYSTKRQDGTFGDMQGWPGISDSDICWGNGDSGEYWYFYDFGNASVSHYAVLIYDRTTGEKVMSLDDHQAFRPQEDLLTKDAIQIALRYYRSFPKMPKEVAYDSVQGYNKDIITDELLNKQSDLPDCSNQHLPQWKGLMVPCMMHPTGTATACDPDDILTQTDIQLIKEAGFNYIGLNIGFASLQEPFYHGGMVNESQLEYLDQVIAWCIQNDIHMEIRCNTPSCSGDWGLVVDDFEKIESMDNAMFTDTSIRDDFAAFWQMLARRYAEIPNIYLGFNLLCEPEVHSDQVYVETFQPIVEAIRKESPDRCIVADIHDGSLTGEGMASLGVALSYHIYEPRSFCSLYANQQSYTDEELESVTWPYQDKNGVMWDAKAMLTAPMFGERGQATILDLKATADKYGVGFMIGEWGIFGTPPGQLLSKTYNRDVIYAFTKDVISTFEEQGFGWCMGNGWMGEYGIVTPYPAIAACNYVQLDHSNYYMDTDMFAFYQKMLK